MSHVTSVDLKIKELDTLEETLAERFPRLELRRNKTHFNWYNRWMNDYHGPLAAVSNGYDPATFGQAEHTIGIKGDSKSYEIGLVKSKSGEGWDLLYDTYDGKIEPIAGKELSTLKREYAATCATKRARATLGKRGFTIAREDLIGGGIRLRLRKR